MKQIQYCLIYIFSWQDNKKQILQASQQEGRVIKSGHAAVFHLSSKKLSSKSQEFFKNYTIPYFSMRKEYDLANCPCL